MSEPTLDFLNQRIEQVEEYLEVLVNARTALQAAEELAAKLGFSGAGGLLVDEARASVALDGETQVVSEPEPAEPEPEPEPEQRALRPDQQEAIRRMQHVEDTLAAATGTLRWSELQQRTGYSSGTLRRATERSDRIIRTPDGQWLLRERSEELLAPPTEPESSQATESPPPDAPAPATTPSGPSRAQRRTLRVTDAQRARIDKQAQERDLKVEALLDWARENRQWFSGPEAAAGIGVKKHSVGAYIRILVEKGLLERRGGERGPSVRYRAAGVEAEDDKEAPPSPQPSASDSEPRDGGAALAEQDTAEVDEALGEAAEADVVRLVRDWVVKRAEGDAFMPVTVSTELEIPQPTAEAILDELARRGIISDESPSVDMRLFEYHRPTEAGKAAELDIARRAARENAAGSGGGVAVAGTGRSAHPRANNKEVQAVLDACVRQLGTEAVQMTNSGHWAIQTPKSGRILIAGTPSSQRTVYNDKARLRRGGVTV